MVQIKHAHKILVGNSEVKRPLQEPSCGWEDNIKIYLADGGRVWTIFS
jgi:hypothetical protein